MARAFHPFINQIIFGAQESLISSPRETTTVQVSSYELYILSELPEVVLVCLKRTHSILSLHCKGTTKPHVDYRKLGHKILWHS